MAFTNSPAYQVIFLFFKAVDDAHGFRNVGICFPDFIDQQRFFRDTISRSCSGSDSASWSFTAASFLCLGTNPPFDIMAGKSTKFILPPMYSFFFSYTYNLIFVHFFSSFKVKIR
jgi:hypothetical protein